MVLLKCRFLGFGSNGFSRFKYLKCVFNDFEEGGLEIILGNFGLEKRVGGRNEGWDEVVILVRIILC